MKKLSTLIKEARERHNLTLAEASKCSGISLGYLHDLESGKATRPKIDILSKIAYCLNISADDLIIAAEKVPQDVYWKIVRNPQILNIIRNLEV